MRLGWRRKAYLDKLIDTAQANMRAERAQTPPTTKIEPVTGPLADLCRDIRENPDRYELDRGGIRSKDDQALWIYSTGSSNQGSCFGIYSTIAEQEVIRKAAAVFMDHERASRTTDLAARLAKVKAEREKADKIKARVQTERDERCPDARRARDVIASCQRQKPSEWADFIADLTERMLPVLEGTHKIVPVDEYDDGPDLKRWTDKTGPVTIKTHTPGDPQPVMRDFLTEGTVPQPKVGVASRKDGVKRCEALLLNERDAIHEAYRGTRTVTLTIHPGEQFLWIDHEGKKHPTDKARLEANKVIEAKRRKQKAGAG